MYYSNFARNITAKHRIVVENWPLDKFMSPSDIGTSHELNTLMNAWTSNTSRFRKLEGGEWEKWEEEFSTKESEAFAGVQLARDQREASPASLPQQEIAQTDGPSTAARAQQSSLTPLLRPVPSSSSFTPAATSTQAQDSGGFVNTFAVTGATGNAVQVVAKPRKKRNDAGIPRGRRQKNSEPQNGGASS